MYVHVYKSSSVLHHLHFIFSNSSFKNTQLIWSFIIKYKKCQKATHISLGDNCIYPTCFIVTIFLFRLICKIWLTLSLLRSPPPYRGMFFVFVQRSSSRCRGGRTSFHPHIYKTASPIHLVIQILITSINS